MIAKRIAIAKMFNEGHDYQAIRNYLKVTDKTITSVNNLVRYGNGGYSIVLNRIFEIEEKRQSKIEGKINLLKPPPSLGGALAGLAIHKAHQKIKQQAKLKSILNQKQTD